MSGEHGKLEFELIALRGRAECLEQDLSDSLHLLYSMLVWIVSSAPPEFAQRTAVMFRAKVLQAPQGYRVGQLLIESDRQFGCLLEDKGVHLERWVFEAREKSNG